MTNKMLTKEDICGGAMWDTKRSSEWCSSPGPPSALCQLGPEGNWLAPQLPGEYLGCLGHVGLPNVGASHSFLFSYSVLECMLPVTPGSRELWLRVLSVKGVLSSTTIWPSCVWICCFLLGWEVGKLVFISTIDLPKICVAHGQGCLQPLSSSTYVPVWGWEACAQ
jgi:hypothetical protein